MKGILKMKKTIYLIFILMVGFSLVACSNDTNDSNTLNANGSTDMTFTLDELSQYTGSNGSTAYIAVNNIVYDVTDVFRNGVHQGMQLGGTDATAIFQSSPHTMSLLDSLPVVGTLVTVQVDATNNSDVTTTNANPTYLPVFTLNELSNYTGANGTTAYIAVNGVIYDVTNVFNNGVHQGMQLGGTDATQVFESSPHALSILNGLPKVGSLEGYQQITSTPVDTVSGASTSYDDDEDDYDDEDEDDYIAYSDLPQAIIDYLNANYPNLSIHEIEVEDGMYEIELQNDLELYFSLTGSFISVDYDD
jgi:predicted heme/steroid binding protein